MTATSALQVQEAFNRRGIAMVFADLVQHTAYTRYITTLFSHLHREPPAGFSRCTVSQIVSADKAVWQFLLESNLRPKRDELGTLPLDRALQTALESYMVSFLLLPHPVRKEPTPSPKKVNKVANSNSGGKGQGILSSKTGTSQKEERRVLERGNSAAGFRHPSTSWVAVHMTLTAIPFAIHTIVMGVQTQLMVQDASEECMFVQNVSDCTPLWIMTNPLDSLIQFKVTKINLGLCSHNRLHSLIVVIHSLNVSVKLHNRQHDLTVYFPGTTITLHLARPWTHARMFQTFLKHR